MTIAGLCDNGSSMPPLFLALAALAALVLWLTPLLLMRSRNRTKTVQSIDRRARWGVVLEATGYALMWQPDFWNRIVPVWRLALALVLLAIAVAISFQAASALGNFLRIDASLSTDHQLIRTGPYRWVRHPVYSSFLCLLIGTGLLLAPLWMIVGGVAVFLCGTEIRVRVEDTLLAARFGAEFEQYRRAVSAYLPGLR